MRRCALYARVSTSQQADHGTSLASQLERCRQYASEHGYIVIREIAEDASGATLARAGLDDAREMVRQKALDCLVVYDPDRFSRSLVHTMVLLDEIEGAGASVEFVVAPRDGTPESEMLFGMRALFAQYERSKILERSRRGKQQTARSGKIVHTWMLPYGYAWDADNKLYAVNEDEAPIVREIFALMASGAHTLYSIALLLHNRAIPTSRGGVWRAGTLKRLLENETYRGIAYYGKHQGTKAGRRARPRSEWIGVAVPPLVSTDTWERAQWQLKENGRLSVRNRRFSYVFGGFLTCARCGYALRGKVGRTGSRVLYYYCPRRTAYWAARSRGGLRCDNPPVRVDVVDDVLWSVVLDYFAQEAPLEPPQDKQPAGSNITVVSARRALQGLEREEGRILKAYREEAITVKQLGQQLDILERRRTEYQGEIERIEALTQREAPDLATQATLEATRERVRAHREWSVDDKRAVLRALRVRATLDGLEYSIAGLFPVVLNGIL